MPGTLVLPIDDSAAGESALAAAVRAVSSWHSSLLILVPPEHELVLGKGFLDGVQVETETLESPEPEALIERVRRAPAPVTLVLSFEAASQSGWLGEITRELLQRPPTALFMADPSERPRTRHNGDRRGEREPVHSALLRRVATRVLSRHGVDA